jgi:hypothetical protein
MPDTVKGKENTAAHVPAVVQLSLVGNMPVNQLMS